MIGGPGRPLRFLGLVLAGWVALRVLLLWPEAGSLPRALRHALPLPVVAQAAAIPAGPIARRRVEAIPPVAETPTPVAAARTRPMADRSIRIALLGSVDRPKEMNWPVLSIPQDFLSSPLARADPFPTRSRFSGSFWLAARGGTVGIADAPQLGGSQAGARLRYSLDPARALSASVRVSAPLEGAGGELGVGLEWRPSDAPVALLAERRFGSGGQPGGTALVAIAGIAPTPLAAGFAMEGYGQAGVVFRDRAEAFADGSLRLARPVARIGGAEVALGVGAWGGAQPGAARLDIGPGASVILPIAEQRVRLAIDWRQRVAGDARPGSGPALTLGTDF